MNERLKYEGRLAEARQEERRLRLRLDGLVRSLRDLLDPTEDVGRLEAEQIADQAMQLAAVQGDLKGKQAEIAKIADVLGRS